MSWTTAYGEGQDRTNTSATPSGSFNASWWGIVVIALIVAALIAQSYSDSPETGTTGSYERSEPKENSESYLVGFTYGLASVNASYSDSYEECRAGYDDIREEPSVRQVLEDEGFDVSEVDDWPAFLAGCQSILSN